jgi:hypothetical protein
MHKKILIGNKVKKSDHFEDLSVNARLILKYNKTSIIRQFLLTVMVASHVCGRSPRNSACVPYDMVCGV